MRRRHEQSMPFGVFVALALLGAIGGLVNGLKRTFDANCERSLHPLLNEGWSKAAE